MNRRKFLRNSSFIGIGSLAVSPVFGMSSMTTSWKKPENGPTRTAKNIIFLVSDGMSMGTLTMTDLMMRRKLGRKSRWLELYENPVVRRAAMDTASADSLVTDSAAAGSSWGGGVRVPNGKLNMGPNGEQYEPILQKFKKVGKAVGCVTTVPITHATPASFCVNKKQRSLQEEIAEDYLTLQFDVMMGGGREYFSKEKRADQKDLLHTFGQSGFDVALSRSEMLQASASEKPMLGVFHEGGLPYTIDQKADESLIDSVPTLAEMTQFSIDKMKTNPNGFVLQVEGGKVDWAAHGNDTTALLNDQQAFDEAVGVALDFAAQHNDTLVIITTDHGNSNPGLFYGKDADQHFEKLFTAKQSHEWILKEVNRNSSVKQIIERIEYATNCVISDKEALQLMSYLADIDPDSLYNPYKLPFGDLASILQSHTNVGWASNHHSADYVELAMYGAGAEMLPPSIQNSDLHDFMLVAAAIK